MDTQYGPIDLSIVVAATDAGVIGKDGAMPWRIPSDLRRFKELTERTGVVVMGRATYEAILRHLGHQLRNRHNIVLTRGAPFRIDHLESAASVEEACEKVALRRGRACIIGGGEVYRQFLPLVNRICMTTVHAEVAGDTTFPALCGHWFYEHHVGPAKWLDEDQYPTSYTEYVRM
jgi:dihydrofolate reductase